MLWRGSRDLCSGAFLALFGLYIIYSSSLLTYVSDEGPGPAFLPFWLGIAIVALALLLIANSRRDIPVRRKPPAGWSAEIRALLAWAALMTSIFLSSAVGFAASLTLLAVFIVAYLERRPLWSALLVGLGLGVGFHLLFVVFLGLSLPASRLGF
jgi:hypothetical protein